MSNSPSQPSAADHEAARLAALERYQILDTVPEPEFDDIVSIAAQICGVPMALISLVDEKRQWFKAAIGLDATETPREIAFCAHAINQEHTLVVEDASRDVRFADNPLVTSDPNLRFYAGAPLLTVDGFAIGTLCVLDSKPRALKDSSRKALEALSRQVMSQLELRQALARRRAEEARERVIARIQTAQLVLHDWLRDVANPSDMSYLAAQVLGEGLQASRAGFGLWEAHSTTLVVERGWTATGTANGAGRHEMKDFAAQLASLEQDLTVVVHNTGAAPSCSVNGLLFSETQTILYVPLIEAGTLVALFFVSSDIPRGWTDAEISFAREVAERTQSARARRRAELELRTLAASLEAQVEARLEERNRLWSSTSELMATVGIDGFLKEVNPAWTRLLGWDTETLQSRPLLDLIEASESAALRPVFDTLKRGEPVPEFTARVRAQDETLHSIRWSAVPKDCVVYFVGRDVTVQEDMEDRLRQSQKMEAIGQLTGGIAHDFNNLLAGILGSVALIRLRVRSGRYDAIERLIDAAEKSAKSAAALTARLLAFSRRQSLDVKASDVNQLVAGMGDLLQRTLGETVELRTVLHGGLWRALTDGNQLENAILNLAINSRDAMPAGGRLIIETSNVTVGHDAVRALAELTPGDYVLITVSDTGCGMSSEIAARAFDPFFTTKPLGEGTGLGLSMIYGFAKQSNGLATIRSEVGTGTTIELYLPRGALEAAFMEPQQAAIAQGQGQTLLVVEDDETLRTLIVDALQDLGYDIVQAGHPHAALQILNSGVGLEILITDVGLPYMNGRQLAEMARQKRPELQVLFLTGYAQNAADRGGFLAQGMHMLMKPFTLDALAGKVQDLLSNVRSGQMPGNNPDPQAREA